MIEASDLKPFMSLLSQSHILKIRPDDFIYYLEVEPKCNKPLTTFVKLSFLL